MATLPSLQTPSAALRCSKTFGKIFARTTANGALRDSGSWSCTGPAPTPGQPGPDHVKLADPVSNVKFVQVLTGIELPCEVPVGRNFIIDHFGGIIISGYASFGDNCRIRDGVVVGLRRVEEACAPAIGNNVDIGSGAKLLGPIHVGNNVIIGANAVVLSDVPDNSIAVGVPATIKPRRIQH